MAPKRQGGVRQQHHGAVHQQGNADREDHRRGDGDGRAESGEGFEQAPEAEGDQDG